MGNSSLTSGGDNMDDYHGFMVEGYRGAEEATLISVSCGEGDICEFSEWFPKVANFSRGLGFIMGAGMEDGDGLGGNWEHIIDFRWK